MADIHAAIPRPVPITLAGRQFLAWEFRLGDIADLQAWLNRRLPSPYDRAAPVLDSGIRPPGWKRVLSEVVDVQPDWPREPGHPDADALLDSDDGRRFLLALSLRREHPGLSGADVAALYAGATRAEWARLMRTCWGADPMRAIADLIDGPRPDDGGGEGPDWPALWYRYGKEFPGGPPFDHLSVRQFLAFRCEGAMPTADALDPTRPDLMQVAERRRKFWEDDGAGD